MECNKNKYLLPATFIVVTMNFLLCIMMLCDIGMNSYQLDEISMALDQNPSFIPALIEAFEDDQD